MRLIDANALRDEWLYKAGKFEPNDVLDSIDDAPTIDPAKWVPVSESLPEEKKQVLVCDDFGEIYIAEYETFSDGEGRWCESVEYRCLYGIVAWMPLPDPWRGEEDG